MEAMNMHDASLGGGETGTDHQLQHKQWKSLIL